MNTFKLTTFPNLQISIQKHFNMKKEWEMMASPSLILFSSSLVPFLGDKLQWKHVICRIQHRDNKVQCNGVTKCTAAMWSHFWCQEELGAGRGARPDLSSRDLSQLFPAPGRASLGTFLSSTLYPDFYVEKARKYSCHILVRSKTALQHRPV